MEPGVLRGCLHVGASDMGVLQNTRELVQMPTKVSEEQQILSVSSPGWGN